MQPELGLGVYSIREASKLTGVNAHTLRAWLFPENSVLSSDFHPHKDRFALSFLDLIDVAVVGKLRDRGLSLQQIRKVNTKLQEILDTPHPFSHSDLHTDGARVFLRTLDEIGEEHLEEVLTRQKAFPKILLEFLDHIEYSEITKTAIRWNISENITLDPNRNLGKPVLDQEGISTSVLAGSVKANNGEIELVADLFGIEPNAVIEALKFENALSDRSAA